MPADRAETFLAEVHADLESRTGVAVPWKFAALRWHEHAAPPVVLWRLGDIEIAPPAKVGGQDAEIAVMRQELRVRIWHRTIAETRDLFEALLRSLRMVALGPNIGLGTWSWVTEDEPAHSTKGAALEGAVLVDLPVRDVAYTTVVVSDEAHDVYLKHPATGNETLAPSHS